ncbi:MAG: helix-turn-helix domain-containing protein [Alphaproteobacteria bacterium]|nr:helix-turn-helix domain-containing protein [Alphaproteobacteria bacterium]MBL7097758.1 helix-turn-helix domain-containing protein [Alphaproteobacteria bacterium]
MTIQPLHVAHKNAVNAAMLAGPNANPSLANMGSVTNFDRNATIFHEGDAADYSYKVVAGAIRLSKMMSDGRRQVAEFALSGDFIGLNWLDEHAMTAEALTDVTLIAYTRGRLERLGDENQAIRAELFSTLRHDLWAAHNHLVLLGRQSALERVACFLLEMRRRSPNTDKTTIAVPMTRRDIADYLGLTIETVCRMLTRLKQMGVIDIPDRHTIAVRNLAGLRHAAEPEA